MSTSNRYSPEVRDRAVRLVLDHENEYDSRWATIVSIASKIGWTPETLRKWILRTEIDSGQRAGLTSDDLARIKELERENKGKRLSNRTYRHGHPSDIIIG